MSCVESQAVARHRALKQCSVTVPRPASGASPSHKGVVCRLGTFCTLTLGLGLWFLVLRSGAPPMPFLFSHKNKLRHQEGRNRNRGCYCTAWSLETPIKELPAPPPLAALASPLLQASLTWKAGPVSLAYYCCLLLPFPHLPEQAGSGMGQ